MAGHIGFFIIGSLDCVKSTFATLTHITGFNPYVHGVVLQFISCDELTVVVLRVDATHTIQLREGTELCCKTMYDVAKHYAKINDCIPHHLPHNQQ